MALLPRHVARSFKEKVSTKVSGSNSQWF